MKPAVEQTEEPGTDNRNAECKNCKKDGHQYTPASGQSVILCGLLCNFECVK